jgi:type VI secretion system secreted protein VgrG
MPADFYRSWQAPSTLSSANRPLRLRLGFPDGARDDALLPQRVSGIETVCGGIEYVVLCLALDAALPLKQFIGLPAEMQFVTDRGEMRRAAGIVAEARAGNSDGGLASYQLVLRDALALLDLRVNSRVFRNKNEIEVIEFLFAEWIRNNPVLVGAFELEVDPLLGVRKFPKREFIRQHNESDAHFVRRLMKRRGIAWFIRNGHSRTGSANEQADAPAHTLVLFDGAYTADENKAGRVRFHRDDGTEQRDAITGWSAMRQLRPGKAARHSWDYRDPRGHFATIGARGHADQGPTGNQFAASLEDYLVEPPHVGNDLNDMVTLGQLRIDRHDFDSKCFHGEGSVRDFCAGEYFALEGHPEIDKHPHQEREFVITELRVHAVNNLPSDLAERAERLFCANRWGGGDERLASLLAANAQNAVRSRNAFTAVRRGVRIVPAYDPRTDLPPTPLESAIVVGPANEEVHCDRLGRVKIRFPSSRADDHAQGAGASGSDTDSAWVRVASNWAGDGPGSQHQCGALGLPRVGSEVLVACLGGDPDKPVIVGQLYNELGLPPGISELGELPGNRYLSGLRSREIGGSRANRLQLDDTQGQISARLGSDHAATELTLGYLTAPRQDGRAPPRGEGAELRSEEAIALRAARGILLSTWKLLGGENSKNGQLARDDYLGLLRECGELCGALGSYAAENNGLPIDTTEQTDLLARFRNWEDGSNTALHAAERGEPVIGVTAPSGIAFASSKAIVSYSASNVDTVAQQHLQMTAGQRFALNAGKGISLFAQHEGLSAIAHFGKLLLQSQHDDTEINSAKDLKITATEGTTTIAAKVIVLVAEDGSFLKLGDGPPVLGSKEPLKFHAPDFLYDGAESMSAARPTFGARATSVQFAARYYPQVDGGIPAANLAHAIRSSDGLAKEGASDAGGITERLKSEAMHLAQVDFMHKNEPT